MGARRPQWGGSRVSAAAGWKLMSVSARDCTDTRLRTNPRGATVQLVGPCRCFRMRCLAYGN